MVEPALSSRLCLGRGLVRAWESSAGDCIDGQLPVWHCFHGFRAFRLELWLCCDSVTPQREKPRLWQALCAAKQSSQTGSQAILKLLRWLFGSPCCPAMILAGVSATHGCP
eukprot:scaffold1495_cov130-Isochrysis_galbana.AAC.2